MSDVKRFSSLTAVDGTGINDTDKIPFTHSSDGVDYGMPLSYLKIEPVATSSTAAATVAKTATVTNFADFTLLAGIKVLVTFTYANTASSPTLNINDTGAKSIANISTWAAGDSLEFVYNGTSWICTNSPAIASLDTSSALAVNSSAVNEALADYQKETTTTALTFNAGSFSGKQLKKNNILTIQGLLTITSAVTAYSTVIATWNNKPTAPTSFTINGVTCYTSGNYIYAQSAIAAGTYYINYSGSY